MLTKPNQNMTSEVSTSNEFAPDIRLISCLFLFVWVAAFTADSETGLQVLVNNNEVVVESWTGEKGSTDLQEIPGVAGHSAYQLELMAITSEGSYIGITEVSRTSECW